MMSSVMMDVAAMDNVVGNGDDEQCDDGKHCFVGGTACVVDSDCPPVTLVGLSVRDVCVQRMTDSCTNFCRNNICGDGIRNVGVELCDDGNSVNDDRCTNACVPARCGDSIVQEIVREQCDDGANGDDLDGCTNKCQINSDNDILPDDFDNCPYRTNVDQLDTDHDSVGDACDNCDYVANSDQHNSCYVPPGQRFCSERPSWQRWLPKYGDACDADYDDIIDPRRSDEFGDSGIDNCPTAYNPEQKDADSDGIGDTCDLCGTSTTDTDGDGDQDGCDNCRTSYNSNQADGDNDGVGDVCDNCPSAYNPNQRNTGDTDGLGDACDNNYCGDGFCRPSERCTSDDSACSSLTFTCYEGAACDGGTGDAADPAAGCVGDDERPDGYNDPQCTATNDACSDGACVFTHLEVSVYLSVLGPSDGGDEVSTRYDPTGVLVNINSISSDVSDIQRRRTVAGVVPFTVYPEESYYIAVEDYIYTWSTASDSGCDLYTALSDILIPPVDAGETSLISIQMVLKNEDVC